MLCTSIEDFHILAFYLLIFLVEICSLDGKKMKKILSLLFMFVFIVGALTIFSGVASALIMTVGDPYEGNSWHQRIGLSHRDRFDNVEMFIESAGSFKNQASSDDYSWSVTSFDRNQQLLGGNSVSNLGFEVVMEGIIPEYFSFIVQSRLGNVLRERARLILNKGTWSCVSSVPDADIMWLLGPAFIILGLLGRKKVKKEFV